MNQAAAVIITWGAGRRHWRRELKLDDSKLSIDMANGEAALKGGPTKSGLDWKAVVDSPAFKPGVLVFLGLMLCFWPLIKLLPDLWGGKDGYYSHGFLVPFISAYIVVKRWPSIKDIPVRPVAWAIIFLIPLLLAALVATSTQIDAFISLAMVATLIAKGYYSLTFLRHFRMN